MTATTLNRPYNEKAQGFTLVEALFAISILAAGLLGLATLIPFSTRNDFRSRIDTTATFIAMRQLEQMLAQPFTVGSFIDAADGAGGIATIALTCGTPPCEQGAALVGERIDFSQPFSDVPADYGRMYTIGPSAEANAPKVNGGIYELRWNISENANGIRVITIAARPQGNNPGAFAVPANLRVVRMR